MLDGLEIIVIIISTAVAITLYLLCDIYRKREATRYLKCYRRKYGDENRSTSYLKLYSVDEAEYTVRCYLAAEWDKSYDSVIVIAVNNQTERELIYQISLGLLKDSGYDTKIAFEY